jgi:tRNA (mo5U34)-methyltransferase
MRISAPDNFQLNDFFKNIYCFQRWEIFPEIFTSGSKDVADTLNLLNFPIKLEGKRILDIAPWNGFFSFECIRRGASECISIGPEDPKDTGFEQTCRLLEIENIKYIRGSIYDLPKFALGEFDIILFLGLIYHLRNPLLALDIVYDACTCQLYCDSAIIDNVVWDKTTTNEIRDFFLNNNKEIHSLPLCYFTPGDETGDPYNYFIPNLAALKAFIDSSGFLIEHHAVKNNWAYLTAKKSTRTFVLGFEGHNPEAIYTKHAPILSSGPSLLNIIRKLRSKIRN